MADQNENAPRPKGNRPAENAIQATPASLLASMNWQGNDAAQDFLGLNESGQAVAQPAPAVPRAAKVAKAVGDESWLMDDGAAEPPQPAVADRYDAQAEHAQDSDDSAEFDGADREEGADERRASPRPPAVLDASWTEPSRPRGKSKAPLVAAAVGLAVLGAAGFFFAQSRSGAKPDVARATADSKLPPTPDKPAVAAKPDAGVRNVGGATPSSRTALDRSGQAVAVVTPQADALSTDAPLDALPNAQAPANPEALPAGYEPEETPIVDGSADAALAAIGTANPTGGDPALNAAPKFEPKPPATSARHAATNASRTERAFAGLPSGMELASSGKPEPASEAFPWIRSESVDPSGGDAQSTPGDGELLTAPNESPEPEAPVVAAPEAPSEPAASSASDVAAAVPPSKPSRPKVRVIGSASTQLSDAKAERPRNDVAIAGVPTTPPPMEPSAGERPAESGANPPAAPVATQGDTAPAQVPAVEVREGVVPPREVLLPGATNNGVRVAGVKDLQSVWDGDSVPMDRIDAKTKVLTPNVGNVRVKLKTKDVFEGRLYAVGENSVWLEGSFGRMGLDHSRISEIERLGSDAPAAGAAKGGDVAAASDRVRVKTPGGLVFGKVVSRDDTKATVVTDAGLRLTVDAKDVEAVTTAPKLVIKQATPTKN